MVKERQERAEEETEERSQTLSLRISQGLRRRLEDVREMLSLRRGERVSTSEVAKHLLEMAGSEQLVEAMFFREPTGALLTARRKLESGIGLLRAEWRLVAQYAQYGTEPGYKLPISAESFAGLLRAFLSLLDQHEGELNSEQYDIGSFSDGWTEREAISGKAGIHKVLGAAIERAHSMKQRYMEWYAARNLWALLERGRFRSEDAINAALMPEWSALWRVAARGHYRKLGEPLREKTEPGVYGNQPGSKSERKSLMLHSDDARSEDRCHLSFQPSEEHGLNLLLSQSGRHGSMYQLTGYAAISEFRQMLDALHPDRLPKYDPQNPSFAGMWDGEIFFGYVPVTGESAGYWFRVRKHGISLGFSEENWRKVQELFRQGWEDPDIAKYWSEMVMEYGE